MAAERKEVIASPNIRHAQYVAPDLQYYLLDFASRHCRLPGHFTNVAV
jgi:hypothetical protein